MVRTRNNRGGGGGGSPSKDNSARSGIILIIKMVKFSIHPPSFRPLTSGAKKGRKRALGDGGREEEDLGVTHQQSLVSVWVMAWRSLPHRV